MALQLQKTAAKTLPAFMAFFVCIISIYGNQPVKCL
jgi:hypothetical protein